MRIPPLLVLLALLAPARADELTFVKDGAELTVAGNLLKEDAEGTILFEGRDLRHYFVAAADRRNLARSNEPVDAYSRNELRAALQKEYGTGFKILESGAYIVVHRGSAERAKEAGRLLNRANLAFTNYFGKAGSFKFTKPPLPLVAVLFEDRPEYLDNLRKHLGRAADFSVGVYINDVNRIFLYDAFGGEIGGKVDQVLRINEKAGRQIAAQLYEQNVSTVVHEAIHQCAFNTGFHHRHVANPIWLVEGMAMFFETPDLEAHGGWKGGKTVNLPRAERFWQIYRGLRPGFLEDLLLDDSRFRRSDTAADSYALAWTVTYYLLKRQTKGYMEYLRLVGERPPLVPYGRAERLEHFEKAFKRSPQKMEEEFKKAIVGMIDQPGNASARR